MFKSKEFLKSRDEGPTSFIDEGSELEGKCTFSGTVLLNGKFNGELVCHDALIIGDRAVVHANVRVATLTVRGHLVGNVTASRRVELRGGARLYGDIETPLLIIEEGVLFEGRCQMTAREHDEQASLARPSPVVAMKR